VSDQERIPPEVDAASVQKELLVWRTPEEFRALVDGLDSRTTSADLWRSNALKFMRDDAISLKEFAILMPVDRVRLCKPPEEHDGQVETNGQVIDVQITATHGGREVAREHRRSAPRKTHVEDDELRARVDAIPDALECAIKKKIAKKYSNASMLVVSLNIRSHGIKQAETEAAIAEIKARHASEFIAIHVLWAGKLF
jgi:hypothetical protein